MTRLAQLFILLLSSILINYGNSQVIRTFTEDGPGAYTYGNSNELNIGSNAGDLYGLLPPVIRSNFILDSKKSQFIRELDGFIDTYLIADFAYMDPKDYNPQDNNFVTAFQRRSDPAIITCKLILCFAFFVFFARLQYGQMGGFKRKVLRLRERNIAKVRILRNISLFFLIVFGICWFGFLNYAAIFTSIDLLDYADETNNFVLEEANKVDTKQTNFNARKYTDYYSDKHLDNHAFNIQYNLKGGVMKTNLEEKNTEILNEFDHFTRWYCIAGLSWWLFALVLVSIHKSQYRRRIVAASLIIAGLYILLLCCGIMLAGFKVNEITQKSEVCIQALNITQFNQNFATGNGITTFIKQIDNPYAIEKTQNQLTQLTIAVNTAYTIYQNRLVALGRLQDYIKIKGDKYVKTLLNEFKTSYTTDAILKEQYFILQDLWSAIMNIRIIYSELPVQYWSYNLANTVCYEGQILDLIAQLFLFLMLIGIFFAFHMAWSSEFILRCVIFEEKKNIDLNKNRHDWS